MACLRENYGVVLGRGCEPLICAYNERAAELKRQFLADGRAYLRAIGKTLVTAAGFAEAAVRCEPSGVAGSGTVFAEYRHPDRACWLYAWLEASCLRTLTSESRPDGLVLSARLRWREGGCVVEGPNHHFLPAESATMAQRLLLLLPD